MKRITFIIAAVLVVFAMYACAQGNTKPESTASAKPSEASANADTGGKTEAGGGVTFDDSDGNKSTYQEHVADLWQQTKTAMEEDLSANYSDDKYQTLGSALDTVWTDLQVHASLDHKAEVDKADEDTAYANLIGHIKDLIYKQYGNGGAGTAEEREKKRENLRDGGLERKFEELDKVVYSKD